MKAACDNKHLALGRFLGIDDLLRHEGLAATVADGPAAPAVEYARSEVEAQCRAAFEAVQRQVATDRDRGRLDLARARLQRFLEGVTEAVRGEAERLLRELE